MEYQEQLYSDWRSSATKVFWGIVVASVFSVFCNFYDMVWWIGSLAEMTYEYSQTGETSILNSKFFWVSVGGKMLIIVGYVFYLVGLTQFAQIQQKESTAHYVYKARTSVILLIIACVISIVFGFVSYIPLIGIFFVIIMWLMYVVTYFIMKHAYDGMMMADDFGGRAKLGAKNVRYAAVCQLRLLFMPLVVLFVALLYALIGGASVYGMRENLARMAVHDSATLESGAIMFLLPAVVMIVIAVVCAILWAICAFVWPMMGWYRIMSDGPADVMIVAQQELSGLPSNVRKHSTVEDVCAISEQGTESSPQVPEFQPLSRIEAGNISNRKWYYIGGGIITALLIAGGSLFLVKGCDKRDGNLLNVRKPAWEKFVMVNSENVVLFKEPRATSPKLMFAMENVETGMCDLQFRWEDEGKKRGYTVSEYQLEAKTVLPVLADAGDWYKVHVESAVAGSVEAYVNKKWCKEVKPQPITEDVLKDVIKSGTRNDYIINKGKLKGLCFSSCQIDTDQEQFELGLLYDGVLIYPESHSVSVGFEKDADMVFEKGKGFDGYELTYGEGRACKEDKYSRLFDPSTLSEKEAEEIYNALKGDNPQSFKVYYYFPDSDADHLVSFTYSLNAVGKSNNNGDDRPEEGVKNYTVVGDEGMQQLMADLDEETIFTGISETYVTIIEEFDDDGDGYHEALVCETCGGSGCPENNYFVYYDKDSKEFKQTDFFKHYSQPEKEEWNGKPSYVQRYGLHLDRYVFEDHQLRLVEDKTIGVGASLMRWTRESLFDKETNEEKTVRLDMDDDGTEEVLTLSHYTSHVYEEGERMGLGRITWEDGRECSCPRMYTGRTITILESMTNGMHDVLIGDAYLYRWSGSVYEEWEWDGEKLVKPQSEIIP